MVIERKREIGRGKEKEKERQLSNRLIVTKTEYICMIIMMCSNFCRAP